MYSGSFPMSRPLHFPVYNLTHSVPTHTSPNDDVLAQSRCHLLASSMQCSVPVLESFCPVYFFLLWKLQLESCTQVLYPITGNWCSLLSLSLSKTVHQQLPIPWIFLLLWSWSHACGWYPCFPALCLAIGERAQRLPSWEFLLYLTISTPSLLTTFIFFDMKDLKWSFRNEIVELLGACLACSRQWLHMVPATSSGSPATTRSYLWEQSHN